jgi:hypothetical protein
MSGYYKQMRGHNEARSGLRERLAREELGEAGYEKSKSHADGRSVQIGIAFIVVVALTVLGVVWLGY